MYYGDQQAYYTNMRASFGPYGGALASGGMGGGGQYYGGPGGEGPGGPVEGLAFMGAQVRPITYMPQARMFVPGSGMYMQETPGIGPSFGRMVGYYETPRNVATADYRINAAADVGERFGTGVAAAGVALGGTLSAGFIGAPLGAAVGRVAGAGIGGLLAAPFGLAPVGGLAGGFVGGAVGGLVGGMGAMQVAGDVSDLIVQQRQLRNYLETSTFRSTTASSSMADFRRGQGMGVGARRDITEMITEMDVKDPMMDTTDLTRTLQGAVGMGLMNNVTTVDEFKRKFKDITENLKLVVRTMNSTLEEGLKTMQEFRGIGVTDAGTVGDMVLRSSVAGRVAGRTTQEMVSVGLQGAEMFRGTGVAMNIGFQAAINNAASIRAARDAGTLSQEAVAQAGGVEALAQRMTVGGLAFAQTGLGRGMGAAFFQPGAGLNQGDMNRFLTGEGPGFIGVAERAARNLSSPGRLMEFQAKQPEFLSKLGSMFGGQGLQLFEMQSAMAQAKFYQRVSPTTDTETALRFSLQNMGKSEPEIEAMLGMARGAQQNFEASQRSAEVERDRMAVEQSYQNFFFTRFKERFITDPYLEARNLIARPVNRLIDSATEGMKTFAEEQFLGFERASLRGIDTNVGRGERLAQNLLRGPRAVARQEQGEINLDEVGFFAPSAGESALKQIETGELAKALNIKAQDIRAPEGAFSGIVLNTNPFTSARQGITHESAKTLEEKTRIFRMTEAEAGKIKEENKDDYANIEKRIKKRATEYDIENMDFADAVLKLTDKTSLGDLTQVEYAAVVNTVGTKKRRGRFERAQFGDKIEAARIEANIYESLQGNVSMKSMQELEKGFEKMRDDISNKYSTELNNAKLPAGVLERVANAAQEGLSPEARQDILDEAAYLLSAEGGVSGVKAAAMIDEMSGGGNIKRAMRKFQPILNKEAQKQLIALSGYAKTTDKAVDLLRRRALAEGVEVTDVELEEAARGFMGAIRPQLQTTSAGTRVFTGNFSALSFLSDSDLTGKKADLLLGQVRDYQATAGARARKKQLLTSVKSMEVETPEEKLRKQYLTTAAEKIDTPASLLSMSRKEIEALKEAGFKDIAGPAEELSNIQLAIESARSDPKNATGRAALERQLTAYSESRNLGWTPEKISALSEKAVRSEGSGFVTGLAKETLSSFSPGTMSSEGPGGTIATQTGTAAEAYDVQTSINKTILAAMQAFASQLSAPGK